VVGMGIRKTKKESGNGYTIVWTTTIKDSNQDDPISLSVPYSINGKQSKIVLPLNASVVADIDIQQPSQKLMLNSYSVHFNSTGLEDGFADNITHRVVRYNAVQSLWKEHKLIPKMDLQLEQILKDIPRSDKDNLQLKTDLAKGVIFCTYLFAVNNIPTGFQSEYLEKKTGMSNNFITQIINRYSVTLDDVIKAKKQDLLFTKSDKLVIEEKTVYFVRHTDRKLKGGYLPMWIEKLVEKELSEIYGVDYKLPLEAKGAVDIP
jgi:hypothetical protein